MTFPATSPSVIEAAEAHGLERLESKDGPEKEFRQIWVTPEAKALMNGETDAYFPNVRFATLIEKIIKNWLVTVSLLGDPTEKFPEFELLHTFDEVWVLCARSPMSSQYRFFGRFTAKGEFVVLFGRTRKSLEKGGYAVAAQEFLQQWQAMFGGECLRAQTCEEYLGGVVINVDEAET